MRIGIVSQWYPPEGALIPHSMAHGLQRLGHEVHVVTGFPNYPSGEIYPGYKVRSYQLEDDNGVTVHRGPLFPSHDKSPLRRAANYVSFALGSLLASFRVPAVDVWLTNCTPATVSTVAMVHSLVRGTPNVMIIQDLWPDSVTGSGLMPRRAERPVKWVLDLYCQASYRLADRIGVISPGMASVIRSRGVPAAKLCYLPNTLPDEDYRHSGAETKSELRRKLGLPDETMFMYAGNFGKAQNLLNLIEAFGGVPQAHLVLIGGGVLEDEIKELSSGLANVHVVPRKPRNEIGSYLAASDLQVVSLEESPLLQVTMPSKVQSSLAAGRPIFAHASGDVADLVSREGVGISAAPSDPAAVTSVIATVCSIPAAELEVMGVRARKLYESSYAPESGAARIQSVLLEAVDAKNKR